VSAELKDGVLMLTAPNVAELPARRIEIMS
jgi:hypothetical protein